MLVSDFMLELSHQLFVCSVMLKNQPCFKPDLKAGLLKYPEYPLFIIVKNNLNLIKR